MSDRSPSVNRHPPTPFTAFFCLLAVSSAACSGASTQDEELLVDCSGKCDGFESIKSRTRDPKELDLSDLVEWGTPWATDRFNKALEVTDYVALEIEPTKFFEETELSELVTGLVAQFGDDALASEVNAARRDHLASSDDTLFAESSFKIGGNLHENHSESFHIDALGFGEDASFEGFHRIGFEVGADIETRIVAPFEDWKAFYKGPFDAIVDSPRGFILPRSLDDVRDMKPGESIAKHGHGYVGINAGAGVPMLLAEPAAGLAYALVFSAAVKTRLEGDLDTQLIRLPNDQVVIDVGIERSRLLEAELAVEDEWGAQGLFDWSFEIGPISVDLGRLAEKQIEKIIDKRIDLINGTLKWTNEKARMTVSRIRFDLNRVNEEQASAAISQALVGDVRLAQAMAHREEPGVTAEFDLLRSAMATTWYAGIDFAGMNFYWKRRNSAGHAVVQTPGGAQAAAADTLHREGGLFFSSNSYSRTALSNIFVPKVGRPISEANLLIEVQEGDSTMERDKLVDHLDALIVSLGGPETLASIEMLGNELERFVEDSCAGTGQLQLCSLEKLKHPTALALQEEATVKLRQELNYVDPEVAEIIYVAADLRFLAQSVYERKVHFVGPGTSLVVGYRLDDDSLAQILTGDAGERLRQSVLNILYRTEIDRLDPVNAIYDARSSIERDAREQLDELAKVLDEHGATYQRALAVQNASIDTLGSIGAKMLEIRFEVDKDNRPIYETAIGQSIATRRAQLAGETFDKLRSVAGGLGPHAEQVVAYGLLGMIPSEKANVRLDFDLNLNDSWTGVWREPYRNAGYPEDLDMSRIGSSAKQMQGGFFDVDQLILYP